MIKRIIVPLDGSEHSESALPYAVSFAKALGASVVLLHAVSEPVIDMFADEQIIWDNIDELRESARRASAEYLQRVSARLTADGITNIVHNVYGVAADVILDYATSGSGDLIAMSTHGRSGIRRFVMGSVATRVVNGTDTPLLLVQPQEEAGADVGVTSVLVPLDMSPHSEEVLPLTRELAKAMKLDMSLIMVIPTLSQLFVGTEPAAYPTNALEQVDKYAREYLKEKAEQIQSEDGLKVSWKVVQGDIGRGITDDADSQANSMIAMSTHGRTGLRRWVLGSVTDKVIRSSGRPVLVVRPSN